MRICASLKPVGENAHAVGGDVGAQALAVVAAVEVAAFGQAGGISVDMPGGGVELFGFDEGKKETEIGVEVVCVGVDRPLVKGQCFPGAAQFEVAAGHIPLGPERNGDVAGEQGFVERDGIGGAAAGGEGAEPVGQATRVLGVGYLAGKEFGGERVGGGQRPVESRKAFRAAQGVAIDDAVADVEGDAVTIHRASLVGGEWRFQGGGLREETEAHGGHPGGLARLGILRLALEDGELAAQLRCPVLAADGRGRCRGGIPCFGKHHPVLTGTRRRGGKGDGKQQGEVRTIHDGGF